MYYMLSKVESMYVRKVLGFCCFCFVAAFFFACSEDLLVSIGSDKVKINNNLGVPGDVSIEVRYRDSVFIGQVGTYSYLNELLIKAGKADQIDYPQFKNPELVKDGENYLEHMTQFLREFYINWGVVENAAGYEVRVSTRPITTENWLRAEKVRITSTEISDGTVKAVAAMVPSPTIYSSRCVNCEACQVACPTAAISMENRKAVIDQNLCIECGECFRSCDFDAIGGSFVGTPYYFGVRAVDEDSAYGSNIAMTKTRYKMRYVSFASLPDSLNLQYTEDHFIKLGYGCGGNCSNGKYDVKDDICWILKFNGCPVEAIYQPDTSVKLDVTNEKYAMFIDFDKCISCGECAKVCYQRGPHGAIVTEMIEVP